MLTKKHDSHGAEQQAPANAANQQPARFSCSLADIDVESLAVIAAGIAKFIASVPCRPVAQIALALTAELSARIAGAVSAGLDLRFDEASKQEILDCIAVIERISVALGDEDAARALLKNIGAAMEQEYFRIWQLNQTSNGTVGLAENLN